MKTTGEPIRLAPAEKTASGYQTFSLKCPDKIRETSAIGQEFNRDPDGLFDVAGLKNGRLTVIARVPECRSKVYVRCDCGNEKIVSLSSIRRGGLKSCGCWKRDRFKLIHDVIDTHPQFITDREFAEKNPVFRIDRDEDGIMPLPRVKKWRAFMDVGERKFDLGRFDTEEEARAARRTAADSLLAAMIKPKEEATEIPSGR